MAYTVNSFNSFNFHPHQYQPQYDQYHPHFHDTTTQSYHHDNLFWENASNNNNNQAFASALIPNPPVTAATTSTTTTTTTTTVAAHGNNLMHEFGIDVDVDPTFSDLMEVSMDDFMSDALSDSSHVQTPNSSEFDTESESEFSFLIQPSSVEHSPLPCSNNDVVIPFRATENVFTNLSQQQQQHHQHQMQALWKLQQQQQAHFAQTNFPSVAPSGFPVIACAFNQHQLQPQQQYIQPLPHVQQQQQQQEQQVVTKKAPKAVANRLVDKENQDVRKKGKRGKKANAANADATYKPTGQGKSKKVAVISAPTVATTTAAPAKARGRKPKSALAANVVAGSTSATTTALSSVGTGVGRNANNNGGVVKASRKNKSKRGRGGDFKHKRVMHNDSERLRRSAMRQSLENLRLSVPEVKDNPKVHTSFILRQAIAYIRTLQAEDAAFEVERNALLAEKQRLSLLIR